MKAFQIHNKDYDWVFSISQNVAALACPKLHKLQFVTYCLRWLHYGDETFPEHNLETNVYVFLRLRLAFY